MVHVLSARVNCASSVTLRAPFSEVTKRAEFTLIWARCEVIVPTIGIQKAFLTCLLPMEDFLKQISAVFSTATQVHPFDQATNGGDDITNCKGSQNNLAE